MRATIDNSPMSRVQIVVVSIMAMLRALGGLVAAQLLNYFDWRSLSVLSVLVLFVLPLPRGGAVLPGPP